MPNTKTFYQSFAAGEMSPEMFGRIDDAKYQSGAAKLRNFIATPQGPAENRAGFRFVRPTKNNGKARLIPFTWSTTQTMVIEMGQGYFRFHTQGATLISGDAPYEIESPYQAEDLFDIHYVQSADVLTLVHPNHPPMELRRLGALEWDLASIDFARPAQPPENVAGHGDSGYSIKIIGIYNGSYEDPITGETVISNIPGLPVCLILKEDHGLYAGDAIHVQGVTGAENLPDGYYFVDTTSPKTLGDSGAKILNAISLQDYDGVEIGWKEGEVGSLEEGAQIQLARKTQGIENTYVVTTVIGESESESGPSDEVEIDNNLFSSGSVNTITWDAVVGETDGVGIRYRVYKKQNGLFGYIGETGETEFIDNNIAPDMGMTPPIFETIFDGEGNYPAAVSYFEQRRIFAGTTLKPQNVWMSRSATESDFSYSLPTKDSDRIAFRIAAREANTIRHIVPVSRLLLLTSSAEWRVSAFNSDVLTPTTAGPGSRPQSFVGSNNVQPVLINNSIVFCAARGGHVMELGYAWQADGFVTGDISIRAAHLFDGFNIIDMAYSKAPTPLIQFVSSSGELLVLTYVPEQQIGAWSWFDTDGAFESCAVVAEAQEDVLYVVVRREVNGQTVRYVERLESRNTDNLVNAFFVDSGLSYSGLNATPTTVTVSGSGRWDRSEKLTVTASAAIFSQQPSQSDIDDEVIITGSEGAEYRLRIVSTVSETVSECQIDKLLETGLRGVPTKSWAFARKKASGLDHLEGKIVSILADGAVHRPRKVVDGTISLERPAVVIHAGLPYVCDLKTLPMALRTAGYAQGRVKNVNKAWVRVFRSSGVFIGPDEDRLTEARQRTTEPYGCPPGLKSEDLPVMIAPSWGQDGSVFLRQADPLPLTVVGLTLDVSIGG